MKEIARLESVRRVLEHWRLFQLFGALFGDEAVGTLAFKWLRAVARGQFTGVHVDRVYVCQHTARMLTAWIPLGDVPTQLGGIAVCERSHRTQRASPFAALHRKLARDFVGPGSVCVCVPLSFFFFRFFTPFSCRPPRVKKMASRVVGCRGAAPPWPASMRSTCAG